MSTIATPALSLFRPSLGFLALGGDLATAFFTYFYFFSFFNEVSSE
ncbi:MAG: hypothetical protein LBI10_04235 [Deltaproteobacteria bacterium]|jgi:hypothetical protein|nr:hypothetical protein [Deltaproteobacteria bacterium]